jgi:hypothetical protein
VRLPQFIDNRLADGGEVVSLTRRWSFTPPKKLPGTHSSEMLSLPKDHSEAGKIRSIEKSNDLIGNPTLDLSTCCIMFKKIKKKTLAKVAYSE